MDVQYNYKVSVVVPIYNVEKYLASCLDSLVRQTLQSIEIILVNDGSTDTSGSIAKSYASNYTNWFYFEKKNGGLSDARNYGILHCHGEFIGFVDSDDYIEADMFSSLYDYAHENNYDVVMCDYFIEYEKRRKVVKMPHVSIPRDIFYNLYVVAWNKLYKRSLILDSHIVFPYGLYYEDTAFFCELIPYIKRLGTINKSFYHYVQRANSIINSQSVKTRQIFNIFDEIFDFYKKQGYYSDYIRELEYFCAKVLLGSSFIRISQINNKYMRKDFIAETMHYLYSHFPKWKENPYLCKVRSLRHLYMRGMTMRTSFVISRFFRLIRIWEK